MYCSESPQDIQTNHLVFEGVTVHPNYDVSLDLYLEPNTINDWSNVFGFQVAESSGWQLGVRIPAVFLHGGSFSNFDTIISNSLKFTSDI